MPYVSKNRKIRKTTKRLIKRRPKRIVSKSLVRAIENISLKKAETKTYCRTVENNQLYHNGGAASQYVWVPNLLSIGQGNSETARDGDEIVAKGIRIALWLSNKSDRPNVMYRIIVVRCPPDQATATSPANLFRGEVGNKMIDRINTDKYSIVYHKYIQPFNGDYSLESGASFKEHSYMFKSYVNCKNAKVKYSSDNGQVPKYQRDCYSLVVIAYDAYGTLTTDNIASFTYSTTMYFKDP